MSSNAQFERLLQPVRIGKLEIKNRIVMSPMLTYHRHVGLLGMDIDRDYFEARARGGAGLIFLGITAVDWDVGRLDDRQFRLDDDKFIPGLSEIAEVIKKHGARAAVQLHHGGFVAMSSVTGRQPVAPSPILRPGYEMPRELTVAEIQDIVSRFATAAERVKRAGFDAVEYSAGHYYLIAEFLSAVWNKRTDEYGGDLKSRARFLLEIVRTTRQAVGPDFPISCRVNGTAYGKKGGIDLEGMQKLAVWLQDSGLDAIHIHASCFPTGQPYYDVFEQPSYGPGSYAETAAAVKKAVSIPVIVAGKMTPKLGEKILRKGMADLVTFGRRLIADPELPNKVMLGRLDDIVPCVHCNCCMQHFPTSDCTVNAAKGREREYAISPASKAKCVVVIGGGPAGMEAARVAALRGHRVTLFEKNAHLGGQLRLASVLTAEYGDIVSYLERQLRKLGVKVITGRVANVAAVVSLKPDAVIVAAGGVPVVPDISGIAGSSVLSLDGNRVTPGRWSRRARWRHVLWSLGLSVLKMPGGSAGIRWLLGMVSPFGRKVVVVGGGLAGLELAEFLVGQGKDVTIVEAGENMVDESGPMPLRAMHLWNDLSDKKTRMLTGVKYEQVTDLGLAVTGPDGKGRGIQADTVVLALPPKANTSFADRLKGKVAEVYVAGDCAEPSGIREAIAAGARVGRVV